MKQKNNYTSVDFLSSLYKYCRDGYINLRFLPLGKNLFIPLSEVDSIPTILKKFKNENAYFGVATRINGDGTKAGVIEVPAFWADVDLNGKPRKEVWKKLISFPLRPSAIVKTGGGYHVYWFLKTPATKDMIPQIESYLKRVASFLDGDLKATDASRILRVPGTKNFKRNEYRTRLKIFKSKRRYEISDFDFLPSPPNDENEIGANTSGWVERIISNGVPEGERNDAITRLSGHYVVKGLSREEIWPILRRVNSRCSPPLEKKDIRTILNSVIRTHQRNHPDQRSQEGVHYRLVTLKDIFKYPDPAYLIDPILVDGAIHILGAYSGVGKSLAALTISQAILTQKPLWGKFRVLKSGRILLIDEETPFAWLKERLQKIGFKEDQDFFGLHFEGVRLDEDEHFKALTEKIQEVSPVLVIIDSLRRVHEQSEIDARSMSLVMKRLRAITNLGTTALVLHHHTKGQGDLTVRLRGSSDIPAGVDIEYALMPQKDDSLILQSVKTRTKPLIPLRLRKVITDKRIDMIYLGPELGRDGNILLQVSKFLRDDEEGFEEIQEALKKEGVVIGEQALRDLLNKAVQEGNLLVRIGERNKKFYRVNPDSQFSRSI